MKTKTMIVLILLLSIAYVTPTQARMRKLAQAGLQFLKIGPSARAEAIAGAYSMIGNDPNTMFYNPAGLSHMDARIGFTANRVNWIADISYNSFGLAYNMGNIGTFGVSFLMADFGEVLGTRISEESEKGYIDTGTLDVGSYVAGLAYSRQLTDKFFIGGQVKYVAEQLGSNDVSIGDQPEKIKDNKISSVAFDFGTMYYTGIKSLKIGMSIRNYTPDLKYENESFEAPLTFRIGAAMDLMDIFNDEHPSHSLLIAVDALHPRDYTEQLNVGTEYWFNDMFALRGGYKINYDTENLTAGLGFKQDIGGMNIFIDYCYTNVEYFDAVNRISLGITF